jgi:hypothetical protein
MLGFCGWLNPTTGMSAKPNVKARFEKSIDGCEVFTFFIEVSFKGLPLRAANLLMMMA